MPHSVHRTRSPIQPPNREVQDACEADPTQVRQHQNPRRHRLRPKRDGRRRDCYEQGHDLDECGPRQMEPEEDARPSRIQDQLNGDTKLTPTARVHPFAKPTTRRRPSRYRGRSTRDRKSNSADSMSALPSPHTKWRCSALSQGMSITTAAKVMARKSDEGDDLLCHFLL